jgi:hypothetical protein
MNVRLFLARFIKQCSSSPHPREYGDPYFKRLGIDSRLRGNEVWGCFKVTFNRGCFLFFLLFIQSNIIFCVPEPLSLSQVQKQYGQALQDLITAYQQNSSKKPLVLSQDPLMLSTYKKLIEPSVVWINQYAQLVASELVHNFSYLHDLHSLSLQYANHKKDVAAIIKGLPVANQKEAWLIFQESLSSVVQTSFDIVRSIAYQSSIDADFLNAAQEAYQLAWQLQTPSSKILGTSSIVDFQTQLSSNMHVLFSAAIAKLQNSLAHGMNSSDDLHDVYAKLKNYYQVLLQVYTNSQDTTDAQAMQALIAAIAVQEQSYNQAKTLDQQADAMAQKSLTPIILDVNNVAAVMQSVSTSLQGLTSAIKIYDNALNLYQAAQDLAGQSVSQQKINHINTIDLFLRLIEKLWGLYVTDQSAQGIYTFPTLTAFAQGQLSGQNDNAVQALQNLSAMISNQYQTQNVVGDLISSTQNVEMITLMEAVVAAAQQAAVNQTQPVDPLIDLKLFSEVQKGLLLLAQWCQALTQSDQANLALAMTCAKDLDLLFAQQPKLNQWIAHLPSCLQKNKSWVQFSAQFLMQIGSISTVGQALALVGKGKVVLPVQPSAQDLKTLSSQAAASLSAAQALAITGKFSAASKSYELAMQQYQKLYTIEPYAQEQLNMLSYANLAKTRFVATSFAGIVQNLAGSYVATSYQLSINLSLFGTSVPKFLSFMQTGKPLQKFSAVEKQEFFALVKAYLVAQVLSDQGYNFTDYFVDYHMTKMVQSSKNCQKIITAVTNYLSNFKNISLNSATLNSDNSLMVNLGSFPLALVTPLCSTLSSVATFYTSAATLFASGTNYTTFGGQSYYPGDDAVLQKMMWQQLGTIYQLQADKLKTEATAKMTSLKQQLHLGKKMLAVKTLPSDFLQNLTTLKNLFLTIQALLYFPEQSAYAYFMQAGMTSQAAAVKKDFLDLYQAQIDFEKECLVGDPTDQGYLTLVSFINKAYVSWASQINDQAEIATINQKIADLYEFAGKQSLNFSYTDLEFPGYSQTHFMLASQYFQSALRQYQLLNNSAKVTALQSTLHQMYYQAMLQNLNLYANLKKNGASYISVSTNVATHVTLEQLVQDFANSQNYGSMDSNEMNLYQKVQDLLLEAAMVCQFLTNEKVAKSTASAAKFTTATLDAAHTQILQFLSEQKLIDAKTVINFAQIPFGMAEEVIQLGPQAFTKFGSVPAEFVAFNQLLFSMIKDLYMTDFLAVQSKSDAQELSSATMQFLNAIQKDASSLQNPSSAYVG